MIDRSKKKTSSIFFMLAVLSNFDTICALKLTKVDQVKFSEIKKKVNLIMYFVITRVYN